MSLGLGDLKKKGRTTSKDSSKAKTDTTSVTPANGVNKHPAGAWARSTTARPWSDDLVKPVANNRARKKAETGDFVVNDEWADLHVAPLFWFDPATDSRLAAAQTKLVELEEKIKRTVSGPLQIMRALFPKRRR